MKYIDSEKLFAEIERRIAAYQKNFDKADNKIAKLSTDGRITSLKEILPFITSLQQENSEERNVRDKQYRESSRAYWNFVLNRIDEKRILPSFKGKLLHSFKNELHTMKQVIGLINHPEIPEKLFDKLALVFATWGGYHFRPKEDEPENSLQQDHLPNAGKMVEEDHIADVSKMVESKHITDVSNMMEQPKVELEKELEQYARNHPADDAGSYRNLIGIARYFYELGRNARKEE